MSKVVLSPLIRAMLKDEKARQQLGEAIGDNSVGGKVEFKGKVYDVVGGSERATKVRSYYTHYLDGLRIRGVVRATNKKSAAKAAGVSAYDFGRNWAEYELGDYVEWMKADTLYTSPCSDGWDDAKWVEGKCEE